MERTELKLFRIRQKMTQEQAAEKLEYSRGHYARFESGEADMTLRFLNALQTAFGISLEEAKELAKRDNE